MPGGQAVKPGDIATSASGQTVEILNTDAEGRLILCDALHYARRFQPGRGGRHRDPHRRVRRGARPPSRRCDGQRRGAHPGAASTPACAPTTAAWQLPLTEEYAEQLKSNFADFANVGGRDGGAITAAAFLGKFTQGLKWAHLDVAGTAYQSGAQKGSTGRPTPLLSDFLIHRAAL